MNKSSLVIDVPQRDTTLVLDPTMFDFLAHWFAKSETVVNNNGQVSTKKPRSHFKNGHFSLDLTFITIAVVILILSVIVWRVRLYYKKKNEQAFRAILDVEMQSLKDKPHKGKKPIVNKPQSDS
jgi:cytochrome oxidase assembly protein ShyY1